MNATVVNFQRSAERSSRGLRAFAAFTAAATLSLLVVGALVTSTDSGDAVPTWPFSPEGVLPRMVGGVLYEYGHRIIAGLVGLLITIQLVLVRRLESRVWVRTMAMAAFIAVLLQASLGGLRVLVVSDDRVQRAALSVTGGVHPQKLKTAIAIIHACLAQTVFCLTLCLAFFAGRKEDEPAAVPTESTPRYRFGALAVGVTFCQLLLGALMRHLDAGLAIPDFPTSFGNLVPPFGNLPNDQTAPFPVTHHELQLKVALHFAHRCGAIVVAGALIVLTAFARRQAGSREVRQLCRALHALLATQLTLGALVIWTQKSEVFTAAHVATGALLLATTLVLTIRLRLLSGNAVVMPNSAPSPSRASDFLALAKPRVTFLVTISGLIGVVVASRGGIEWVTMFHTLVGTILVVAATNGLNQVIERGPDSRMKRTANRPLPAGRLGVAEATFTLVATALVGLGYLWLLVNPLTSLLALVALANYLFVYTPLKPRTTFCTAIGAVSGAIPPMMGWTAVRNELSLEAWTLFAILLVWQFPHFLAIAWLYREDYAAGGFLMLPVVDADGSLTSRQIVAYSIALIPLSLLPTWLGMAGAWYFLGALALSSWMLSAGLRIQRERTKPQAKRLLMTSVVYLPALLLLMSLDRVTL